MLSTVQDLGRTGFRSLGINWNGVMDRRAAVVVNTLLGNDSGEALIELHYPAGEFTFEGRCSFAIGGADFGATLNGIALRNWGVATGSEGDVLRFPERQLGTRAYLGVAGGFAIGKWLSSKSTNLAASAGGFEGRKLAIGDRIKFAAPRLVPPRVLGPSLVPRYSRFPTVRAIAGGEYFRLTAISEQAFLSSAFTLTNESNRMGYRLAGPQLYLLEAKEMVSTSVTFGTIQLLPSGQLIVLMADHQTTGGYPRIANVIEADLPLLAQIGAGDGVSFHLVSVEEAEDAMIRYARELNLLRVGLKLLE